jgi:hypothetical protein
MCSLVLLALSGNTHGNTALLFGNCTVIYSTVPGKVTFRFFLAQRTLPVLSAHHKRGLERLPGRREGRILFPWAAPAIELAPTWCSTVLICPDGGDSQHFRVATWARVE